MAHKLPRVVSGVAGGPCDASATLSYMWAVRPRAKT